MPVKTRSQTKLEKLNQDKIYEVNIDFDLASEAWKSNKRYIGNGTYTYVCAKSGKNNKKCVSRCLPGEIYCKTHLKMFKEGKFT
jgi:hypothetical protein